MSYPALGEGIGLIFMLIDTATGKVVRIQLLGLEHEFSEMLIDVTKRLIGRHFSIVDYDQSIGRIYGTYSTKQIVAMSKNRCYIGK